MRMKPKTLRRLTLLAAVGCLLVIAAFSLVFVRKWQGQRLTEGFRVKALAAQKERDYYATIENAGSYLKRGDQRDPEILLAYAEARLNLQENDGRHLRDATQFYQRYLEIRPDDAEAKKILLETYNKCGFFPEAADLAVSMRPADLADATGEHLSVLEQEAVALVGAKRLDSAEQVINRIAQLDPLNPYAALLRVDRVAHADPSGRAVPDLQRWTQEFSEKHPEEPVALLTQALALTLSRNEGDVPRIRALLAKAANVEIDERGGLVEAGTGKFTSPEIAMRLVEMMDMFRMHDAALAVLRDFDTRVGDDDLRLRLVRRLWQDSAMQEVVRRTEGIDPASHTSDPVLLGLRALSLDAMESVQEADAIVTAMAAREGDFRHSTWRDALTLMRSRESVDLKDRVTSLKAITKDNPHEPVFQAWLGDTLRALARNDEALAAWRAAYTSYDGKYWVLPRLRRAEMLLREGRLDEANEEATEAMRTAPNRAVVGVVFFEIQAARLQRGLPIAGDAVQLAMTVAGLDQQLAVAPQSPSLSELRERMIPPQLIFLSRSGRAEEAKQYGRSVLEGERELSVQTLEHISLASASERLGLEELCAERVAKMADTSATVQFSLALEKAASGRVDEGRKLLAERVAAKPDDVNARIVLGRYLERVGDSKAALAVWRELGERFPENLSAQRSCLESGAIAADAAFLDATIGRYEKLAGIDPGSEDSATKLARARGLMYGTPTQRDRDRAVAMLASVISSQPRLVQAKRQLAAALTYSDASRDIKADYPRAIGALTEAITIEPTNTIVALELAMLLQLQGRFDEARRYLNPIASNNTQDLFTRRHAAEMLIRQGDATPIADKALEEIAEKLGDQTPASVLVALAEIYESRGRSEDAEALYRRLADGAATDLESLYMTARHYARAGDQQRVVSLFEKAASLPNVSSAANALLRGRLAAEQNEIESAKQLFEEAAKIDPKLPDVWLQHAGMLVRKADYKGAISVAERGLKAIPGDRSLSILIEQAKLLDSGGAEADIAQLTRDLASSNAAESGEILAAVKDLKAKGMENNAEAVARLSDRFPRSIPLQSWAIDRMLTLDQGRAIALVRRALDANPTDPAAARLAAGVYLKLSRWPDVLAAARTWRERDGARSSEPDIAIARAHIEMRQYDQALSELARWLRPAISAPEDGYHLDVLHSHGQALIRSGRQEQALSDLLPAFQTAQVARIRVGMLLAAEEITDPQIARKWVNEIIAAGPPDSLNEQLAAASVLSSHSARNPADPSLFADALAILQRLAARPDAEAAVFEGLGMLLHLSQDVEGAERQYRKALELDANRSDSLNNLAVIMQDRDINAALELAQRAVGIEPRSAEARANHLDTLASIHVRLGERAADEEAATRQFKEAAKAYLEAGRLKPSSPELLLRAGEYGAKTGEYSLAIEAFERSLSGVAPAKRAGVLNNLAVMRLKRNASGDLTLAREEAIEAVRMSDSTSHLDTLGWVQLAVQAPREAETTFRRALKAAAEGDPNRHSLRIGLATALVTQSRRSEEAGQIIAELERAELQPQDRERLATAKARLQTP